MGRDEGDIELTSAEVCKLLNTNYWAVYNLHRRGAIPDTRWHGHARVYLREDVERIADLLKLPMPAVERDAAL